MITANSRQIAIRLPHDELEAARQRAKETERTLTAVIVDALREDRRRHALGKFQAAYDSGETR